MHPEARLHALARQTDAGQAPATQESELTITELGIGEEKQISIIRPVFIL